MPGLIKKILLNDTLYPLLIFFLLFPLFPLFSGEAIFIEPINVSEPLRAENVILPEKPSQRLIHLARGSFDPLEESSFLQNLTLKGLIRDKENVDSDYYILQFAGPVIDEWKNDLKERGVVLYGYIPEYAFTVKIETSPSELMSSFDFIRAVIPYRPYYKMQKKVLDEYMIAGDKNGLLKVNPLKSDGSKNVKTYKTENLFGIQEYLVDVFPDVDSKTTGLKLKGAGAGIVRISKNIFKIRFRIKLHPSQIEEIACIPEVKWIEKVPEWQLFNNKAGGAGVLDVHPVWSNRSLFGSGQVVCVADSGLDNGTVEPATLHDDFENGSGASRVVQIFDLVGDSAADNNGHGTHVAGSVLGNGHLSGADPANHNYPNTAFAGMAPEASLVFQATMNNTDGSLSGIPDDLNVMFSQAAGAGAKIHTNSWGAGVQGSYTGNSMDVDEYVWNHKDFTILFAAGNDGTDRASPAGVVDNYSMGSPGTAKNCITVGATENNRPASGNLMTYGQMWPGDFANAPIAGDKMSDNVNGIVAFSSRGPCMDSRYKPDIMAPGSNILSVRSSQAPDQSYWANHNEYYAYMGGTSMATPLVCGMAALAREYINNLGVANPPASMIKALLLNGTTELNPGQYGADSTREISENSPNDIEGWGRASMEKSLPATNRQVIIHHNYAGLSTGQEAQYQFQVLGPENPLKIKLVWTDYPGNPAADGGLVNNLNMTLTKPDAGIVHPLSPRVPGYAQHLYHSGNVDTTAAPPNSGDLLSALFVPPYKPFEPRQVSFLVGAQIPGVYYMDLYLQDDSQTLGQITGYPVNIQTQADENLYIGNVIFYVSGISISEPFYISVGWNYGVNFFMFSSSQGPSTGNDFYYSSADQTWYAWANDATHDLSMDVIGKGPESQGNEDSVNNVEGIEIPNPANGLYTIKVKGQNVAQGPQAFSVVLSGNVGPTDTPTPTPTATPTNICGDANGDNDITPSDAQWVFECYLGRHSVGECDQTYMDVNCDQDLSPGDAQMIFEHYLKGSDLNCCP